MNFDQYVWDLWVVWCVYWNNYIILLHLVFILISLSLLLILQLGNSEKPEPEPEISSTRFSLPEFSNTWITQLLEKKIR
jgi:hypothetical protein